ncbi:hypothetical protein [Breznakiella homolactica]|uniref:Phosphoribosyltransferase domain-containing protein n=1 Tax=Breznakiella homolactica TaxID=2798577 RepID=A0A7T8BA77_9SPIR|nr:hypothetical protein [Breznakiella homolactica]QQO10384.1 hypothetical protein JFL75_05550 [Breznakiella homolactica]
MANWKESIKIIAKKIEIGPIWSKTGLLKQIIQDFEVLIKDIEYDAIATVEMGGIIYAAPLSAKTGKPLLIFRKLNKITYTKEKYVEEFINWKNETDGIEIEKALLEGRNNILFVDDIIETLSTVKAVNKILGQTESRIVQYISIGNISQRTEYNGIKIQSLINQM